ncbi:hemagglutinin repeat-containing protein [Providencia sp. PROV116]|uniref:hemagglutinin repeat-containing protein n=1 Tax=Providencia sp. PROV116 TaxID=2949827 RepID=UPI000E0E5B03|nr:hemagglutinin repeat-containing protein [Providencia rettgeri]
MQHDETTREKGSLLSGEKVTITTGNDLTVKGSSVVAENDVSLTAGNNVDITADNKLHVGGADLIAQKDLNFTGDSVQIDPGYDAKQQEVSVGAATRPGR